MCLAQGHNTVTPVRLESVAPRSRVEHSTTEQLCSLVNVSDADQNYQINSISEYVLLE